jgi:H/ACA ribonucleoprotein complex subunit 2
MGKDNKEKKEKKEKKVETEVARFASPIAHPMAEDKLSKKIHKTVKKGKAINPDHPWISYSSLYFS